MHLITLINPSNLQKVTLFTGIILLQFSLSFLLITEQPYILPMLETTSLRYAYPGQEVIAFPDLNFDKGQHGLILGQSGSGKTTLLHLLGGLLTPRQGAVTVNGVNISTLPASRLDQFRGRNIGIIFQRAHFIGSLSVGENLILAQHLAGLKPDWDRVAELLSRLNLSHKIKSAPDQLSIGEQQRVAIARAIINHPSVILADEPTSALDDHNAMDVIQLLEEQAASVQATLLVVTHDSRLKNKFPLQIQL